VENSDAGATMPVYDNKKPKNNLLRRAKMKLKLMITLAIVSSSALSGCVPLIIAGAGAGAVVAADSASENKKGGDGLF
jgi:hypothetical protein